MEVTRHLQGWHEVLPLLVHDVADQRSQMCSIGWKVHGRASLRSPSWISSWLLPGSWRSGRGRLAADAEVSAFLVCVADEGEIEAGRSINSSREPVICKLVCADKDVELRC